MAMNQVQFQPGLSMSEFYERYGTETQCEAALFASRWPSGWRCPVCQCASSSSFLRNGRRYWQCSAHHHQSTLISSTVFEATKLPKFNAVNTVLSNLKTALAGTYHSFNFAKYAHRYLAEVQYRFNRRFDLAAILPRLLRAAAVTRPQPGRLLRAAEVCR